MDELTKKQRGFVKDYIETGNATQSVKNNYDVSNDLTARVIGSENLTKPNVINAIKSLSDRIPDELLIERHTELLNKREMTVYGGKDGQPVKIDLGPETQAVTKALDMSYKLKGYYAPEKTVNLNVEVGTNKENLEIANRYEEELKKKL